MDRIETILWDIDGPLLNFEASERAAIRTCFSMFGLGECTDEMLAVYSAINRGYWQRLERGEMTKPQILVGRFRDFFRQYGLNTDCVEDFNRQYQLSLGDTVCFHPHALETVLALRGKVRQYAVTNGTLLAQQKKLRNSGLDKLLDGVFISEQVGADKPNIAFFQKVWDAIGPCRPDTVMIVGDSLTSDIQGGNNAGIPCCWFNPKGLPRKGDLRIAYEIRDLSQVLDICGILPGLDS